MKPFLETLDRPVLTIGPAAAPIHRFLPGLSPGRIMFIVVEEVCYLTGIMPARVLSHHLDARTAMSRQICMWLANQVSDLSDREIGGYLRRHHSDVHHGRRAVRDRMDVDSDLHQQLTSLAISLRARLRARQIAPIRLTELAAN